MEPVTSSLEHVTRLTRDLRDASVTLSEDEARFLVDYYYAMQEDRIRAGAQVRSLVESSEPHSVIAWLGGNVAVLEQQIKRALDAYTDSQTVGVWAKSIVGIGPIIAAGLSAHIDIKKAPTVGHIWRFAGLDPTVTWEKKTRRPWNASLKTLCWKIGESFVKVSGHEEDVYGKLYLERKAFEQANNLSGSLSAQATAKLERFKIGKDTDARIWYAGCLTHESARLIIESPSEKRLGLAKKLAGEPGTGVAMLPPAHIHARAKRWAVKLFLAHWHAVAYRAHFGQDAPKPYVISQLQHGHEIVAPNWPF